MKLLARALYLGAGALAAGALSTQATVQLRISDGIDTKTIVDQSADDMNPDVGAVSYTGTFGTWVVSSSAGVSKPLVGSAGSPQMDLNSLNISSVPGSITIELTDTDFSAGGALFSSLGGTTQGEVAYNLYRDAGNIPFATSSLLASHGPFGGPAYGDNQTNSFVANGPYSATIRVTVTHAGSGLSSFDAFMFVTPPPPEVEGLGCRTTGGGRQADSFPAVRYVTHGGQVGAPVGNETAFSPDSECIQGNWQHVRHIQGGLRGNFHAKSFDSLMCACLGCPEDPNAPVTIGDVCNPENTTCGPLPRKAPANKIAFSGVGDYVLTRGNRKPRTVLFRVDLEDRGEPGNSSAKGSKAPHDRHRIRIWILTEQELAKLNDPNDRLIFFRHAISAPNGLTQKDGATFNGVPVPNGTAVFGVRAPDIDDGGDMTHGNHQIHPSIKPCAEVQ